MFIDGKWCEAQNGARFPVFNPATGEEIGRVPDGGAADTTKAIDAASKAFPGWAGQTAFARAEILHNAYRLMVERKEELAQTMTREQGKPIRASRFEVQLRGRLSDLVRRRSQASLWRRSTFSPR